MKASLHLSAILSVAALAVSCSSPPRTATQAEPAAPAAQAEPQTESEETADDVVPEFTHLTFNAYPMRNVRPRAVEITVDTHRNLTEHAHNRVQVLAAVRGALETSLARSKIQVVSSSENKINFDLRDCRNVQDAALCVAVEAVFKSPKFELEVGGISHNTGDVSRAYAGAINAVMERLNKQLEIVGMNQ